MWISTVAAAKEIGCTILAVHRYVEKKRLVGEWMPQSNNSTRSVLKICPWSCLALKEELKSSKRIRRNRAPMKKGYNRKPTIDRGYRLIFNPSHPRASCQGYVPEHILIMEKHLNRFLEKGESVHHLNRIRDDNRIENLILFANQSDHMKYHHGTEVISLKR